MKYKRTFVRNDGMAGVGSPLEANDDIGILGQACTRLGLEILKNKKSFRWYGKEAASDHAITVPGANYEIGVVKKDGLLKIVKELYLTNNQ